jgi:hypothetical protein
MKPKSTKPPKEKQFVVVVSEQTHKDLKAYAKKCGYKVQFIADEAIIEYLKRKDLK